jgi:hypothetical protein
MSAVATAASELDACSLLTVLIGVGERMLTRPSLRPLVLEELLRPIQAERLKELGDAPAMLMTALRHITALERSPAPWRAIAAVLLELCRSELARELEERRVAVSNSDAAPWWHK